MDHTYTDLQKIIHKYSSGELSKEELGIWAEKAYCNFLINNFLTIENIYTYPFIRTLSTLNTVPDDKGDIFPCPNFVFEKLTDIINGKTNYFYSYRLNIPWAHKQMNCYRDKYFEYETIKKDILKLSAEPYEKTLNADGANILTVIDLLEFKIINTVYALSNDMISGSLPEMFGISEHRRRANDLTDMLVKYIDCILGKRGIVVELSYCKGKPYISIYPDCCNNLSLNFDVIPKGAD